MAPITKLSIALPLLLTALSVQARTIFMGCTDPLATPLNPTPVAATSVDECADACSTKGTKNSFAYYHSASIDSCVCSPHGPGDMYDIAFPDSGSECAEHEVAVSVTHSGHSFTSQPRFKRHLPRSSIAAKVMEREAKSDCPSPLQACKTAEEGGYQCIDPQYAINSCGGCINGSFGGEATGSAVDCTLLPGVASGGIICSLGQCKAYRCVDGYKLDSSNTCVKA